MTKLKLGPLPDDKPVKVTVELPASLHRDLTAYAEVLAREMADYIAPRPGFTPHPLTVGAANEMLSMLKRASPFRDPRAEGTA